MLEATTTVRVKGYGDRKSYSKEFANSKIAYVICADLNNNEFFDKKKMPTAIALMMSEVLASGGKIKAECIIADTLQRHNSNPEEKYAPDSDSKHQQAKKIGDEIAKKCVSYIAEINKLITPEGNPENAVTLKVTRWDALLNLPAYDRYKKTVAYLFGTNADFKASIQKTVSNYAKRQCHSSQVSSDDNTSGSQAYVLEETAMMGILADLGFNAIIYPARCPAALDAAIKSPLIGDSKIKWCQLKYNEKSGFTSDLAVRGLIRDFYSGKISGLDFFGNETIRAHYLDTACLELAETFKPRVAPAPNHRSSSPLVSPLFGPTTPPNPSRPYANFGMAVSCFLSTQEATPTQFFNFAFMLNQQMMIPREKSHPSNMPREPVKQLSSLLGEETAAKLTLKEALITEPDIELTRALSWLGLSRRGRGNHSFFAVNRSNNKYNNQQSRSSLTRPIAPTPSTVNLST